MNTFCHELADAMRTPATPHVLFERLVATSRELGFEFCALGVRMPYPLSRRRVEILNNYPRAWQEYYAHQAYLERDPSVAWASRSTDDGWWNDQLFATELQMWSEARSVGLRHGWFKSSLEVSGGGAMLTLARSADALGPAEIADKSEKVAWLTHAARLAFTKAFTPDHLQVPEAQLTSREIEILRWTADGKSSSQIADILCISDNTVNFHIKNAVKKLRASNKTAATVRAAMSGLLG